MKIESANIHLQYRSCTWLNAVPPAGAHLAQISHARSLRQVSRLALTNHQQES